MPEYGAILGWHAHCFMTVVTDLTVLTIVEKGEQKWVHI
jgi:hypothetical protein